MQKNGRPETGLPQIGKFMSPACARLPDETPNLALVLRLLFRRKRLETIAHRVDEKLLANRETHRQELAAPAIRLLRAVILGEPDSTTLSSTIGGKK
jgi:hypothetical protein